MSAAQNKLRNIMKVVLKPRDGFMVVELIISLALLLIVLALTFTFYSFGSSSFQIGETQTDVQQNARLAANFITKEIRICERIVIVDEYEHAGAGNELGGPLDVADLDHFDQDDVGEFSHLYHLFLHDGLIYHQKINGIDEPKPVVQGITDKVIFDLEFSPSQVEPNLLNFNILVEDIASDRDFYLDTEVLALNLMDVEEVLTAGGTGSAIYYLIPAPPEALIRRVALNDELINVFADPGMNTIDVLVETANVADDARVYLELFRFSESGPHNPVHLDAYSIQGDLPKITNNTSQFTVGLDDNILLNNNFYYGDYFARISVDGVTFPQRRNFYLLADLSSLNVSQRGKSHISRVEFTTRGVETGTDITAVQGVPDGLSDNLEIGMIDSNGNAVQFNLQGTPTIDSNGEASFNIQLDNNEDSIKAIDLIIAIGKTSEEVSNIYGYQHIREINISGSTVTVSTTGLEEDDEPIDQINLYNELNEDLIISWPDNLDWIDGDMAVDADGYIIFSIIPGEIDLTSGTDVYIEVKIKQDILASDPFNID